MDHQILFVEVTLSVKKMTLQSLSVLMELVKIVTTELEILLVVREMKIVEIIENVTMEEIVLILLLESYSVVL